MEQTIDAVEEDYMRRRESAEGPPFAGVVS